ncbi:MAG: ATP-binding cassette domain-containing protein [Ruminococcaceae bacterium]|nr:ATP-binding cassette domain-containing protein [Oscillospiraceae bacterium]
MYTENRTVFYGGQTETAAKSDGQILTIFDADKPPFTIHLGSYNKTVVDFGRSSDNDIVFSSPIVSRGHGRFVFNGNEWFVEDKESRNGTIYNSSYIRSHRISDGDFIRIDDGIEALASGVLMIVSSENSNNKWISAPTSANEITIGRDERCTISLPHISVSKIHAKIVRDTTGFYIYDNNSTNGVLVNGKRIIGRTKLHEKDVIVITNSKLIFTSQAIHYCCYNQGISVDAEDIVVRRGKGAKSFITCNHVRLNIKPGELVAIIGGSGAGKSTILNCISGYLKPTSGKVFINGTDLYNNYDFLKKLIGYVPQQDIVYDNLTLHDMLMYTAKLRLPADTSTAEKEKAIARAIELVELKEKTNHFIKSFSGGQRKRASIAVELLSDPNLLFLDEPSSGLDPGTERNLMSSLRNMANTGKTVILVTHSTLQLKMCDKIVFMGKGGNLCFFGSHDDALKFFGVDDVVDIYNMITDEAPKWSAKYASTAVSVTPRGANIPVKRSGEKKIKQLAVLSARYVKLIFNDRQRLLLLLLQAPALAALIAVVTNEYVFNYDMFTASGNLAGTLAYQNTRGIYFALACCCFWVGMLNAIQEICKERNILRREFLSGLSLWSYLGSKLIVLGVLSLVQSLLICGVFSALVGLPEYSLLFPPFVEMVITTWLSTVAAASMGLLVSSMFSNPDRAMTLAPILLMPQILFSGIIFKLEGVTKILASLTVCKWNMAGYGSSANLCAFVDVEAPTMSSPTLMIEIERGKNMITEVERNMYCHSAGTLFGTWFALIVMSAVFVLGTRFMLARISKENS